MKRINYTKGKRFPRAASSATTTPTPKHHPNITIARRETQLASPLQLALTSVGGNAGGDGGVSGSSGNVLAGEVGEEGSVGLVESARAAETVDDTGTAKGGSAGRSGRGGGDREHLAVDGSLDNGVNVLEDVAFSKDVGTGHDLEGVAGVVVPVVVDLSFISHKLYRSPRIC